VVRVSELAQRTGVPIPTLKYYLREGLLHPGESESRTRASYDESHVARVRLVRALVGAGGLGIEQVKEVVRALEDPPATRHELLGTAHSVLSTGELPADSDDEPLVAGLGWPVQRASPASRQVAAALGRARAAGWDVGERAFRAWARAALVQARADVSRKLGTLSPSEALEFAILGTALTDPVILALRRLAQEAVSAERLGQLSTGK
jgi:DNA-binding transcriptional MerR regulator